MRCNVGGVGEGRRRVAVLIPVKPFRHAKTRLAPILGSSERESLSRSMLRNVVASAQGMRVAVVAPDHADDVRRFALVNGLRFLAEPTPEQMVYQAGIGDLSAGLDLAVGSGVDQLAARGYDRVIIIHSDLPLVRDITWLADTDGVIVVPDGTGSGTNAISIPAECGFGFAYGEGSFERHMAEAIRLGFDPKAVADPEGVSADVDMPEDVVRMNIAVRAEA